MTAKILAIFGGENEAYFKAHWQGRMEEVKLWDGTVFWFLFNEADPTRLQNVVFFLWHPEHLNRAKNPMKGEAYDKSLGVIAKMASITRSPEQEKYQETRSQRELDDYAPSPKKGQVRMATLKRTTKSKAEYGLVLKKIDIVEVECDFCGLNRLDLTPYFKTMGMYQFYGVAKGKCEICEAKDADGRKGGSYFVPTDLTLPWVQAVPYWVGPKSKKTAHQIDAYWRAANVRRQNGEPMSTTGKAAQYKSAVEARKAAQAGESPEEALLQVDDASDNDDEADPET